MATRLPLIALCAALIALSGCGSEYPMAPVTGKVTCKGQAVTEATIIFSPVGAEGNNKPGKAASATLNDNGEFTLTTYRPNDGAIVGKHRVAISFENPYKKLACTAPEDLTLEVVAGKNHFDIELDKKK